MPDTLADYDFVIVGGGAAGCLLADRLSLDKSVSVLLVESGEGGDYFWSRFPIGTFKCKGNPRVDWNFTTEPVPGLNGRQIPFPSGKGLGGSTAIGGMIYLRGQPEDYDGWASEGNTSWSWDEVRSYFLSHEDQAAVPKKRFGDNHAAGGELRVEAPRMTWPVLDAWAAAAVQAGVPMLEDFNQPEALGAGYFGVTQKAGFRFDSSKAFVQPALKRQNLSILTQAQVDRISIADGRARGVLLRRKGIPMPIGVRCEVILAAGAIGSPAILMRSGVGAGEVLQHAGVTVVREVAGVGRNLQDHLEIPFVYRVKGASTLNERSHSYLQQARMVMEFALKRSGPMTMAPAPMGALAKSDEAQRSANVLFKAEPFSVADGGSGLDRVAGFTISVSGLRPTSRGGLWIASPDASAPPAIQPNYLETDEDKIVAVRAMQLQRHIAEQSALSRTGRREVRPGDAVHLEDELLAAAGDLGRSGCDAVGTCRMGNDERAVVDERLKVHGLEGVRVIDASIMPTIVSGCAGAATLMIAEKGAAMVREDWKG